MPDNTFIRVDEVAAILGISKSYAYKIVRTLNQELKEKGFLTVAGRVSRSYFMERTCYTVRYPNTTVVQKGTFLK